MRFAQSVALHRAGGDRAELARALLLAGVERRLAGGVATLTGDPAARRGRDAELDRLTRREIEVLRLVAEGLSKAAVAARLGIRPRTVDAHLVKVCGKLGVSSRAPATR